MRIYRLHLPPSVEPTEDDIRTCAYFLWHERGRPAGRELDHWLEAKARLRRARTRAPVLRLVGARPRGAGRRLRAANF